jgi:hypothetical protein
MKIKVVKCSDDENYQDLVGEEFIISSKYENDSSLSYVIAFEGKTRLVLAKDCVNWDTYKDEQSVIYGPNSSISQLELFPEAEYKVKPKIESAVRVFESGAKRDSDLFKPYVHNLQGYTRLRFGYLTRLGAIKYGDGNFLLGMPSPQALESLDRHLAKYISGDRTEDHLAAMIFNIQLVMLNDEKDGITADHYFKQAVDNK